MASWLLEGQPYDHVPMNLSEKTKSLNYHLSQTLCRIVVCDIVTIVYSVLALSVCVCQSLNLASMIVRMAKHFFWPDHPPLYPALIDSDSRKKRVRNTYLFNTCLFKVTEDYLISTHARNLSAIQNIG